MSLTHLSLSLSPLDRYFIERDWWIFRHIIHFLRTDSLPADALLLEELHNEANFYRLSSLKDAIERVDPRQLEAAAAAAAADVPRERSDDYDAYEAPPRERRGGPRSRGREPLADPYAFASGGY